MQLEYFISLFLSILLQKRCEERVIKNSIKIWITVLISYILIYGMIVSLNSFLLWFQYILHEYGTSNDSVGGLSNIFKGFYLDTVQFCISQQRWTICWRKIKHLRYGWWKKLIGYILKDLISMEIDFSAIITHWKDGMNKQTRMSDIWWD